MSKYFSDRFKNEIFPVFAQASNLKSRSVSNYLRECKNVCDYCRCDFLELKKSDVQRYFDELKSGEIAKKDGTTYSRETIAIKYSYLRAVASYILDSHMVEDYYPPFGLIKIDSPNEKIYADKLLSKDQIRNILEKTKGTPVFFIVECAFLLGLSDNEIIKLKTTDYGQDGNGTSFLVISKNNRTAAVRKIAIPEFMQKDFDDYYKSIPGIQVTFFANTRYKPLTLRTLQRYVKTTLTKAGYPDVTLQRLRSNSAVHSLSAGADVSAVATQLGISERHIQRYSDVFPELLGQASSYINL